MYNLCSVNYAELHVIKVLVRSGKILKSVFHLELVIFVYSNSYLIFRHHVFYISLIKLSKQWELQWKLLPVHMTDLKLFYSSILAISPDVWKPSALTNGRFLFQKLRLEFQEDLLGSNSIFKVIKGLGLPTREGWPGICVITLSLEKLAT